MSTPEDGARCPRCGSPLVGDLIFDHFLKQGKTREEALECASRYGADETSGRWINIIVIKGHGKERLLCSECQKPIKDKTRRRA
jgi:hypothetical protein